MHIVLCLILLFIIKSLSIFIHHIVTFYGFEFKKKMNLLNIFYAFLEMKSDRPPSYYER